MSLKNLFSSKTILYIIIIVLAGWLSSEFPDEAILIGGVCAVVIIGIWMLQADNDG